MKLFASLIDIKKSHQKSILDIKKFDIFTGKCTIITGNNGSGKSTLLKIINGLIDADSGSINYENQSFLAKKKHLLAAQSVYLSAKTYLFDCSVESNIGYPLLLKKKLNHQHDIDKILHWADISHLRKRRPNTLSSGEIQRVALARARIINPKIWLLDEPTENLDSKAKQQFYQLLNKLLLKQRSIIIATHSPEIADNIPNETLELANKQLKKFSHN